MPSLETYPVAIIEDRYSGTYSGGKWLAFSCANERIFGLACFGGDGDAMAFWLEPPKDIGVGSTPQEALEKLLSQISDSVQSGKSPE